jgi:hypothetical protein
MIVSPRNGDLILIRQTDHATLSGVFAERWGNETFERPEPRGPVLLAAAQHDNGWQEWEAEPKVNPATALPYQFTQMPVGEHLAFYLRGVERVIAEDQYAGLLVSMHCAGLYKQRYGTDLSMSPRSTEPEVQATVQRFLDRLEAQQVQLRLDLHQPGLPTRFVEESRIWTNYRLLQVYDRLSLFLCMLPVQPRRLGPTPVRNGLADIELALQPIDERTIAITPFPFEASPLRVSLPARIVPKKEYRNDGEFRDELDRTQTLTLAFELRAGG